MPLVRKPLPFDHPEWIFELKYDGFRSLAVIQNDRTQLISRNGHPFSFDLRVPLQAGKTVLGGEIVCVDEQGEPQFRGFDFQQVIRGRLSCTRAAHLPYRSILLSQENCFLKRDNKRQQL